MNKSTLISSLFLVLSFSSLFATESKIPFKYKLLDTPSRLTGDDLPARHIILTFDDGPNYQAPQNTLKILDTLEDWGVKGHFFQVGWTAKNARTFSHNMRAESDYIQGQNLTQAIYDRGHVIAGHTNNHAYLANRSFEFSKNEIISGDAILLKVLNRSEVKKLDFFRFPGGSSNAVLRNYVLQSGRFDFHWNMDSGDWQANASQASVLKTTKQYIDMKQWSKTGGMIVFHDFKPYASLVIGDVLSYLKQKGWTVVLYVGPNDPRRSTIIRRHSHQLIR